MQHWLVGVASEEEQHVSSMQLMGGAPRTYACIQITEVETAFTAKVGSWEDR